MASSGNALAEHSDDLDIASVTFRVEAEVVQQ
jgi:hypothetical protein